MENERQRIEKALRELVSAHPRVGALVQWRFRQRPGGTLVLGALSHSDGEHIFPIYSIAKSVLALCALRLCEERMLDLDGPISMVLARDLPSWLTDVTLRQLLSHRSGLADYGSLREYHEAVRGSPGRIVGKEEFILKVLKKGPQFEKGTSFHYSNVGYLIVREVLERVSGMTLQDLFHKMIGQKLNIGMKFLYGASDEIMSGYSPYLDASIPDVRSYYDFSWVFHGTFHSTVSDLTELFLNLDKVVSAESLQQMTDLHRVNFPHAEIQASYGLGLMGDLESRFGAFCGHNGGGPGFSVSAYTVPDKELAVTAVVNQDSSLEAEKLIYSILNEFYR